MDRETEELSVLERQRKKRVNAYLNKLHKKMDIFGVELSGEILDGLMKILRQRILVSADRELIPPNSINVILC